MPGFSVKKPLTVFVAVLAVVILGVVAYLRMTPDLLPNMDFPYAVVVTTDPGASPEAMEERVTRPLEQSMATLEHIKSVTSVSQNSVSMVVLEFEDGTDMDTVGVDMQQKIVALSGQWGETVSSPYVLKVNPSVLPTAIVAVSYHGRDIHETSDFVTGTLLGKLEGIAGVAGVNAGGVVATQAHVILNQEKMDSLQRAVAEAVEQQMDQAARQLKETRARITGAQAALADARQNAVGAAVENALGAVQSGVLQLTQLRQELQSRLARLEPLAQELAQTEAELAAAQIQIATLEQLGSLLPAEASRLAALQAQAAELEARRDAKAAELRALGAEPGEADAALEELRGALAQAEQVLSSLTEGDGLSQLAGQVSDGVVSGLDALTQLSAGTVQIQQALAQIDQGLASVETYRQQALQAADLTSLLSVSTLSALLTAQNFSMPAGYIQDDDGVSYLVSVGDLFSSREQLEDLLLFDPGVEGVSPIRLRSVADVVVTDNADEVYTKINGENGVSITFTKQSNYATAAVSDNLDRRFAQLEAEYPGLKFEKLMDQGYYIHLIVKTILSSLLWGALFAVLVLFLFLRDWRPTVITLLSIPVSVIFAVVLMYFCGVTINMISLSGLAVSVGMLVDNSVVVIENIYRLRAKGATAIQSAVSGARQVLGAITASTLTTAAVFLPIVFVEGITKQLFTDLALTMTFSLLASLLVALTLVPAMASGLLRNAEPRRSLLQSKIYPAYRKALAWSLDHKAAVLAGALALLMITGAAAVSRGFAFMPQIDANNVSVTVTMPENCTAEEARALADEVSRRAMTIDEVETVGAMMSSGGAMANLRMAGSGGDGNTVSLYMTLPEGKQGLVAGRRLEELCADLPCQVTASTVMSFEMLTGSGVSAKLYGDEMEDLQSAARTLAARMEQIEGLKNVSDGLEDAVPALRIVVDRTAAMERGMTVAQIYLQVASALSTSVSGADLTLDGVHMSVVIESPEQNRLTRQTLPELLIRPSASSAGSMSGMSGMSGLSGLSGMSGLSGLSGESAVSAFTGSGDGAEQAFRLGEVATVEETVSLSTISRDQQRRYVTVSAEVEDGYNVTRLSAAVQQAAAAASLPDSVTLVFDGENEAIMDAMGQVLLMLALGVLLVYFIMVAQFQSLKSPFIVMFTIPLAFTGGFLALLAAGIEVSVISLIGFVMLVGIIVNNGIVLVDYINRQRLAGLERREAIIDAGVTRMRPILMTSLTTILGLAVMALAQNVGTALMRPVALVCIGGLLYATLMTLFVVPCIYDMLNKKDLRNVDESELKTLDL